MPKMQNGSGMPKPRRRPALSRDKLDFSWQNEILAVAGFREPRQRDDHAPCLISGWPNREQEELGWADLQHAGALERTKKKEKQLEETTTSHENETDLQNKKRNTETRDRAPKSDLAPPNGTRKK
jgi:hypothetical protein